MEAVMEAQKTDLETIRDLLRPMMKGADEQDSLQVRVGVKYDKCYEVSFCGKMGLIKLSTIPDIKAGTGLEVFLAGLVHRIRCDRLDYMVECPECRAPGLAYSHAETRREVAEELRSILAEAGVRWTLGSTPADWVRFAKGARNYLIAAINTHERENRILAADLDALVLSSRTAKGLRENGINLVGDLVSHTEAEVSALNGVGLRGINEIRDALHLNRLKFREPSNV